MKLTYMYNCNPLHDKRILSFVREKPTFNCNPGNQAINDRSHSLLMNVIMYMNKENFSFVREKPTFNCNPSQSGNQ